MEFLQVMRELSGGKPVGFKLCVGQPHEFAALCHAMLDTGITPDFITVDGAEGGTGAAPLEFQNSMGFPLAEGLTVVDSFLIGAGLRSQVKLIGSGKVHSGFSLMRTLSLGADVTNAARAFMFSLGCIQALKCNSNTCPTGITTQNPMLESGLDIESKSERVANLHAATVHSALEIAGGLGLTHPNQIKPSMLYRRTSGISAKDFGRLHTEFFPQIKEEGMLIDRLDEAPPYLRKQWLKGKALHENTRGERPNLPSSSAAGVPASVRLQAYKATTKM
jgi:glutamate synthase domain-containing protein 2